MPYNKNGYFELYRDAKNEWRWRFKSWNHEVVADSAEGYVNQNDCKAGIFLIWDSKDAGIEVIPDGLFNQPKPKPL
jgi:uncharacterized protein YegP (UPF0339 family)